MPRAVLVLGLLALSSVVGTLMPKAGTPGPVLRDGAAWLDSSRGARDITHDHNGRSSEGFMTGRHVVTSTHAVTWSGHPSASPMDDRIVFQRGTPGEGSDLFTITPAGELVRVTRDARVEAHPAWAPDGRDIVFAAPPEEGGEPELFRVASTGGVWTRLTWHPRRDREPVWSPDGRRIAFASDRDGGFDLYLLSVSTGEVTRLTTGAKAASPDWSPDGTRIAFQSDSSGQRQVYIVDVRTGGTTPLLRFDGRMSQPAWSPDGRTIAFSGHAESAGQRSIYLVKADGSGLHEPLADDFDAGHPTWSHDGEWIAYDADHGDGFQLFLTRVDGLQTTRLTVALPPSRPSSGS